MFVQVTDIVVAVSCVTRIAGALAGFCEVDDVREAGKGGLPVPVESDVAAPLCPCPLVRLLLLLTLFPPRRRVVVFPLAAEEAVAAVRLFFGFSPADTL
jgi:hypothetical protein